MRVFYNSSDIPESYRGCAIAIGNFDGVHRGHQALVDQVKIIASDQRQRAGVMVFEPHPREYFRPEREHFRLTPLADKLTVFESLGLDFCLVMTFDATLAAMTADTFCKTILHRGLKAAHVIIGYDFHFGKDRGGSPEVMQALGKGLGFDVTIVPEVTDQGDAFSSTAIRLKLAQGDVVGAAKALGRWWKVRGTVIGGAHRGAGLGFPTANIPLPKGTAISHGIYAVRVHHDGAAHDGAAYLGTRPTFDDGKPVLEVFLLDYTGDLYDHELEVSFIDFIRPDRKFDSAEALVQQMEADCQTARARLAAAPETPRL